jgi:MFS family permease
MCQISAYAMRSMAMALLVYRLTGSVALLGVMSLIHALPGILLPLFGGVIADRLPKKYSLVLGQAGSLVTALIIAVSLTLGFVSEERAGSWWILMAVYFLSSSISNLTMPSRHAIIAELVGTDHVMNAISLSNMGRNFLRLGAPALAGLLIDTVGFASVYYITSGINSISLILVLFLPITGALEEKSSGFISQLKDGLKYVRGEAEIIFILAFSLVVTLLSWPYHRLMPIFVDDILKVGATGMGILLSASAIGALVGSMVLASLPNKNRGKILLIGAMVLGLALTGFAFSPYMGLSLALMVFVGIGQIARMTISNALIQYYSDPNYRGRVMSLYTMEEGLSSLGVFGAAMFASVVSAQWAIGVLAMVLVLLSLLAFAFFPRIRKLD